VTDQPTGGFQSEGGHGAVPTTGVPAAEDAADAARAARRDWPLWEVFVRARRGLSHQHVGSLHAPDAEMAIKNARDVYTRRNEGVSIWAVRAADIVASAPSDKGPLFEPANSKVYRHPTFYEIPEKLGHM
jgi:ring-1,2-phenylacetyl-CoA epoxidase subunit PaaB